MTPEAKVKKEIREYIDSLPETFRIPTITKGYGKSGLPDEVVCHKGIFMAIEIKAPGKHTTPWQDQVILDIIKAGGVVGICWSLKDAKSLIEMGAAMVPSGVGNKIYKSHYYHH